MKTKVIIVLSILFSFAKLATVKPSKVIWDNVKDYWQKGLMYNESEFYFVFDEYNYTKFDLSSKEMMELQKRQGEIYRTYNIRNYIFAVKTLDTSIESIENAANSLSTFIEKDFKVDMSNSVIALIVMDLQKVRIRTGSSLKKITDSEAQKIISNMGTNMRAKNYYKAFYNIITDIKYYYLNEESSSSSKSKSKNTKTANNSSNNSPLSFLIFVVVIVVFFSSICFCQKKGYCKNTGSSSSYHRYKRNRHNRESSIHNYGRDDDNSIDNSFGGGDYSGGGGGGGGGSGGATGGW